MAGKRAAKASVRVNRATGFANLKKATEAHSRNAARRRALAAVQAQPTPQPRSSIVIDHQLDAALTTALNNQSNLTKQSGMINQSRWIKQTTLLGRFE